MTTLANNGVWLYVFKFGQNHIINSHSYAFTARPTPHVALIHANITTMGCFKVSIVGALTSVQFIVINKYLIHNVALIDLLDFYKFKPMLQTCGNYNSSRKCFFIHFS
jgi:hypothetical protein